jgi:hypothetical protein
LSVQAAINWRAQAKRAAARGRQRRGRLRVPGLGLGSAATGSHCVGPAMQVTMTSGEA